MVKHRITPQADKILRKQLKAFRRKFGRDPGPGDPVFFDPAADTPTEMSEDSINNAILQALLKSGAPPEVVFAYRKTGLLLVQEHMANYPPENIAEWNAAIAEYFELERSREGKTD